MRVTDLHRDIVDDLHFSLPNEEGQYQRISPVLDCWFESGAMPYAQAHYPFENQQRFEDAFPAEFIAEGLDQTRGWFYTLTVLATALFDKPAFKNVIVNGIVMAEDGKKMSKSLRNYTPPDELMEAYGADALRLYAINSGLVKGEEQRFTDSGVKDMVRLSDARMSGTAFGTIVLHIAPESAVGGPLALVKTGDLIRLDVPNRSIELLVDDAEIARRRDAWKPPPVHAGSERGYLQLYLNRVTQAPDGCDFDFLIP